MNKITLPHLHRFSNFISKKTVALFLSIIGVFSLNAQVSSYVFSETSGATYTAITGGTVIINNASAAFSSMASFNNGLAVTIPFTFYYDNVGYSNVSISDNGFIILGSVGTASVSLLTPLSTTTTNDSAIVCYGANLASGSAPGTAEIRYETIGTAPNRVFVVQYKDMQRRPTLAPINGMLNMQIRLYESTGIIETLYRDAFTSTAPNVVGGQVGLRGATNADFSNRKQIGLLWPSTAAGTVNTDVLNTAGIGSVQGNLAGTKFTWTPCFNPNNLTAVLASDNTTINVSWINPIIVPQGGFDWEVRTSGASGSGSTGLFASGNTASNAVTLPGLTLGITYYIYIKANCGSNWLPAVLVTPVCNVASIPYTQDFESVAVSANTTLVGVVPPCNSLVTISGSAMGVKNNTSLGYYGFNTKNLITTGSTAQNAWYFTQAINFPSAGSYKLSYKYGGSREQTFFQQKMKVYYGTTATVAGMATLLADHSNIVSSPNTNTINFTVSTPGNYFIGFYAYSNASQGYLQLDDITVDVSTCLPPSALVSGQVTSGSAIISWTAPASSPSNGYEYYFSTSNTAPISTTAPSGSTTSGNNLTVISGLTPSTTYYVWVRSVCSSTDSGIWSTTYCTFTTPAALVYCNPVATSQDLNGITNVTMGSINNTTGQEVNGYRDYSTFITNVAQSSTVAVNVTFATGFTYWYSMWVDWNNDGDFNDTGESVYVSSGQTSNAVPVTVTLSFVVPTLDSNSASTLGPHRVRIGGIDDPTFQGGALTPCRMGQFQVFEDYSIYVIAPPPPLTISDGTVGSSSTTICAGENTCGAPVLLTSNPASYQVYTWTPNNGTISGNILTGNVCFNPTTTTTYILTASQTSGNFASSSVSYTVYVNPLPTPITITPASPTMCQTDAPLPLVSTGGIVASIATTVFNENFNNATNIFTTVNNSVGGTVTNAEWGLHNSPYVVNSVTTSSNDNTQFYQSNSELQGVDGTTNTELISPVFSLVGYTDVSLSFWHYYKGWPSGSASVEISTDGGATYIALPVATWTTNTQGSPTGFSNVIIDLSAYVGQANMKIRFNYSNVNSGWYWNIDNVKVSGTVGSNITWSPVTGLSADAVGAMPYTGQTASTVYAHPSSTTTYTATSVSPEGCSTSQDVTVTVIPVSGGTTSGNQSLNCAALVSSNITLSGYNGTIVKWQYSPSSTFASGVVDIPNTTAVLTISEIGQLYATRFYRAVVSNGSCMGYSTISGIYVFALSTTTEDTETSCDSYTWAENNQTYTTSGDYTHVTYLLGGCTNTAILHLTIISSAIINQPENTSICSAVGSVASVSVTTATPSPYFEWQYRVVNTANPNPAWITIASALNTVYSNINSGTLTITKTSTMPAVGTEYRAIVYGYCGATVSDSAKIIVVALVKAGTITSASSVCADEDITFTLTNYSGTSIQWQSAPIVSGTFVDIPGATDPTYTLFNAASSSDKSYRAIVTSSCNNTSATTIVKTITVNPISEAGSATGGGIVCVGGSGTLKLVNNVGTIQWQYSLDGFTYLDAPTAANIPIGLTAFSTTSTTATSATYLVTTITTNVYFRARVTSGACTSVYSNAVQYVLGTSATAGTITSAATGPICKGTGATLTLSGAIGVITWEKSTNWLTATPTWTATTNHTTTFATGNLTVSTAYRAKVTIGSCSTVYADYVPVLLIAAPLAKAINANTTSPAGTTALTALCTNNTIPKILTESPGYNGAIQWQWSTTSTTTGFTDLIGETNVSYTISNPVVGANFYRVKLTNSCGVSAFSAVRTFYYKLCTPKMERLQFSAVAYPNPYTENFNVSVTTSSDEVVSVSIYDMTGRLIEEREVKATSMSEIKFGERYPSGIYNIQVTQGINSEVLRVIKQ